MPGWSGITVEMALDQSDKDNHQMSVLSLPGKQQSDPLCRVARRIRLTRCGVAPLALANRQEPHRLSLCCLQRPGTSRGVLQQIGKIMKTLIACMATVVVLASTAVFACDDHYGDCSIEAWLWRHQLTFLSIEGVTTCDEGRVKIRMYDGDRFIGVADGLIRGHALEAYHLNLESKPTDFNIKYSIEAR